MAGYGSVTGFQSLGTRRTAQSPTVAMARRRGKAKQSGGSRSYGSMADEYQTQLDEAKAANERRYEDILGGYEKRYSGAMSTLEGLGGQQRADLDREYTELGSKQQQNLASRGLAGTTLAPTLAQGLAGKRTEAMTRLNESLKRERLGYDTGLSQDTLQFKERRTDAYPDLNQMQQLAYMRGQGQGQAGGGGGRSYGANVAGGRGWAGGRPNKKRRAGVVMPGVGPMPQKNRRRSYSQPASQGSSRISGSGGMGSMYLAGY